MQGNSGPCSCAKRMATAMGLGWKCQSHHRSNSDNFKAPHAVSLPGLFSGVMLVGDFWVGNVHEHVKALGNLFATVPSCGIKEALHNCFGQFGKQVTLS